MSDPGLYIAMEGIDGCGKTTQARLLAERLDAVLTRENGGTPVGARLRSITHDPIIDLDPWCEVYLFAADRAQHLAEVVCPAIESGRIVVSDRSIWSSVAYQGAGRMLGTDEVLDVNVHGIGATWPDVIVLLDIDLDTARQRVGDRSGLDRIEGEGQSFMERVHGYYSKMRPAAPLLRIEALGTEAEVHERIMAGLEIHLP